MKKVLAILFFVLGFSTASPVQPANDHTRQSTIDAAVAAVILPRVISTTSTYIIRFAVKNEGLAAITDIGLSYKLDANNTVNQLYSNLNIAPGATRTLAFTATISNVSAGAHTLLASIGMVNLTTDQNQANNQLLWHFIASAQSTQRACLLEEFGASTCATCAAFNSYWDQLLMNNSANVPSSNLNVLKYQMNLSWPGNDSCYNLDGLARRLYYEMIEIPAHYTNGQPGLPVGSTQSSLNAEMTGCDESPAFFDITGAFWVNDDSIKTSATITPLFNWTGGNFKVHMGIAEKHYVNPYATTTQSDYYNVMRMMLNAGDGAAVSNWVSGTPQHFKMNTTYQVGTPNQLDHKFWSSPLHSDLVIFVQDDDNKDIMQSKVIPAAWGTLVKEAPHNIADLVIFPNPAAEQAILSMEMIAAANITITVADALGRCVYSISQKTVAGANTIKITTANFAAGIYNVRIQANEEVANERITVMK